MLSTPVPAKQSPPLVSLSVLAFAIASRNVQLPSPDTVTSSKLLTLRFAAQADELPNIDIIAKAKLLRYRYEFVKVVI
jgi:hypothetical protein